MHSYLPLTLTWTAQLQKFSGKIQSVGCRDFMTCDLNITSFCRVIVDWSCFQKGAFGWEGCSKQEAGCNVLNPLHDHKCLQHIGHWRRLQSPKTLLHLCQCLVRVWHWLFMRMYLLSLFFLCLLLQTSSMRPLAILQSIPCCVLTSALSASLSLQGWQEEVHWMSRRLLLWKLHSHIQPLWRMWMHVWKQTTRKVISWGKMMKKGQRGHYNYDFRNHCCIEVKTSIVHVKIWEQKWMTMKLLKFVN